MDHPRLYRLLRIAVTVLSHTACVLLIALWVRSYRIDDFIYNRDRADHFATVGSNSGAVYFIRSALPMSSFVKVRQWTYGSVNATESRAVLKWQSPSPGPEGIALPYWLLLAPTATLTAAPWLPWRFTLRTLLIAMTLVAVVLGLIAWATRT